MVRRLLVAVPVVAGILFLTFLLVRIGQHDPAAMLAGPIADPAMLAKIRQEFDLDRPLPAQFITYMGKVAQGDLGTSWQDNGSVLGGIMAQLPVTLELILPALVLSLLVGVPVGLRAAERPNGWYDQITRGVALLGFSLPTYWLGLMAILVFFYLLRLAPPPMGLMAVELSTPPVVTGSVVLDSVLAGNGAALRSALQHLVLPVLCLTIAATGPVVKQTRAVAVELMGSDHVRYVRACGFPPRRIRRIVLRGALVPLVAFAGTEFISLFATGSLIEFVFARGGLGWWGLNAIVQSDFAVVQGYVLTLALLSMLVFLAVDALTMLLEPRA